VGGLTLSGCYAESAIRDLRLITVLQGGDFLIPSI